MENIAEISPGREDTDETDKLKKILSWRLSDEELKRQVQNYSTLKLRETYRGKSALITLR